MGQKSVIAVFVGYFLLQALLGLGPLSRDPLRHTPLFAEMKSDVLVGHARGIRSDEWYNTSPRIVGLMNLQKILGPKVDVNPLLGAGVKATPTCCTSNGRDLTGLILSPHSLPFYLFPGPHGYAASIALLQTLILLTALALLLIYEVPINSPLILAAGLSTLAFSPHVQRWLITGGFADAYLGPLALALWAFLRMSWSWRRIGVSLLLVWSAACLLNTFYPPQLYAYCLLLVPAAFAKPLSRARTRDLFAASFLILVGFFLAYLGPVHDYVADLSMTYLSNRTYNGGDYPPLLFVNLFSSDLKVLTNVCEDATALVGPLAIGLLALSRSKKRYRFELRGPQKAGLVIGALMLIWMLTPVPGRWVHAILLDRVSPRRMSLGFYFLVPTLLLFAAGHAYAKSAGLQKRFMKACFAFQIGAMLILGLLWNPIANMKAQARETPIIEKLRHETAGGFVLASSDVFAGDVLAPLGIRSLLGRFDGLAPELAAFLLASKPPIQNYSKAEQLRPLLFAPFYFLWNTDQPHSVYQSDGAYFDIEACDDSFARAGIRSLLTNPRNAQAILERCPNTYESTPNFSPHFVALRPKKASPAVLVVPKGVDHFRLIEDVPVNPSSPSSLERTIRLEVSESNKRFGIRYRYEWNEDGLSVQLEEAPGGRIYFARTMIESRFLVAQLQRQEAVCASLRNSQDLAPAIWQMDVGSYLSLAKDCVFKTVEVDSSGKGLFRFARR